MSSTPIISDLDPSAQLRLAGFLEELGVLLGNKTRRQTFASYALGMLGDTRRKSAEPIAATLCPDPEGGAKAMHFKLCNFLRRSVKSLFLCEFVEGDHGELMVQAT